MQRHRPKGIMDGSRWCIAIFLACCIIGTDGVRFNFWNNAQSLRDRRQTFIPLISSHPNGATSVSDGSVFILSQPATAAHSSTLQQPQPTAQQRQQLFHVNVADNTAHFIPQQSQDSTFLLRQGQSPHILIQRPVVSSAATRNSQHHQLPPLPQLPQSRPPVVHQFGQGHLQAQAQTPQHQQQRPPQQNNFRPFFNPFDQFEFDFNQPPPREQQTQPLFRPLTSFPPQNQQTSTESNEDFFNNFSGQRPLRPSGPLPPQPSLTGLPSPQSSENNFQPGPDEEQLVNDIRFPGPPEGQQPHRRPSLGQSNGGDSQPGSLRPSHQQSRPSSAPSSDRFPLRPVGQPPRHPSFDFEEDPFAFHRPPVHTQRPVDIPRPSSVERPRPSSVERPRPSSTERPRPTQQPTFASSTTRGGNRGSSRFRPSDFGVDTSSFEDQQQPESQPPEDDTESFGIPPPTDDFGSKLENAQFQTSSQAPRRPATSSPPKNAPPPSSTTSRFQQPFIEDELPSSSPFPLHPPFHPPSRGQLRPTPQTRPQQPQRPTQFFPQQRPIESQNNFRPDASFSGFFPPPPPLPDRESHIRGDEPIIEVPQRRPFPEDPFRPPNHRPITQNEFQPPQRRPIAQNEFQPPHRRPISEDEFQPPNRRPISEDEFRPPNRRPIPQDAFQPPRRPTEPEDSISQRPTQRPQDEQTRQPPRPVPSQEDQPRVPVRPTTSEEDVRPLRPFPRPSAIPELHSERRPFFDRDFQSRPPPNAFDGENRPTFGPQSVDQIQPPEEAQITRRPFVDITEPSTPTPTTLKPPSRQRPRPTTTTETISTESPQRTRAPQRALRTRTRRPITTTEADNLEVTSTPPRRRVRPSGARITTTTTEEPSTSVPRRRVRPTNNQQRPQFRSQRKNATRKPVTDLPELSDRQVSASIQQQTRRPPTVSRSQITTEKKPTVTRMVIKRRRPVTTTPPASGIFDHSFSDHQLSPSRRKVSIVSKFDSDNINHHHQDEPDTRETHITDSNEHSSVTEVAAKVRDHSENIKPSFKTTISIPTTTTTTTEVPTTTLTTITTESTTTAESTTAKITTEPEALNKLRNLLNRKFVFKATAQSPTK